MIKVITLLVCCTLLFGCSSTVSTYERLKHSLNEDFLLTQYQYIASDQFLGRKSGTNASLSLQNHLVAQLQSFGVLPFNGRYQHPFNFKKGFRGIVKGHNIIGMIPSSILSSDYIILTAHYDHLGSNKNKIYNGADDNASGTATLLALAKKLSSLKLTHNILLLFTDGEESNLKGSKAFVKENESFIKHIKLNINMDMLAGGQQNDKLYYLSHGLDQLLTNKQRANFIQGHDSSEFPVFKGFNRDANYSNRRISWLKASDHYVFYRKDIPFIYYGVGIHKNYHTVNDTYENSNKNLLINSANLIFHQLIFLDKLI